MTPAIPKKPKLLDALRQAQPPTPVPKTPRTRERPWNLNHPEARAARLARTMRPLPSDATEAERKAYTVARERWRRARNLAI